MRQQFRNQKNQNKVTERKTGYFQKDPSVTTIYVGNLRYKRDEKDIKKMFEQYGKVAYAKLVIDEKTQKSKGGMEEIIEGIEIGWTKNCKKPEESSEE